MSISRRVRRTFGLMGVAFAMLAAAHCGAAGTCVRFSDCDPGMTCGAAGECVPAAPVVEASTGDGGVTSEASVPDVAHIDSASADAAEASSSDDASDDAADATSE